MNIVFTPNRALAPVLSQASLHIRARVKKRNT